MRVAVVGHVEWIEFAVVDHVPIAGEIVHADHTFQQPAGGGAVAAMQLDKLGGEATLYTALGDDRVGHACERELSELGLRVSTVYRDEPQRRGFVFLDSAGERTITVLGPRLGPHGGDELPWDELDQTAAVYFTAGDAAGAKQARRAGVVVSTTRALEPLAESRVQLDALVSSANDPGERYEEGALDPPPRLLVRTEGSKGGTWLSSTGESGRWDPTPPPGPIKDSYGSGDSFAAGLTFGLGSGWPVEEALELAARCGAACLTGRGPYEGQLSLTRQ